MGQHNFAEVPLQWVGERRRPSNSADEMRRIAKQESESTNTLGYDPRFGQLDLSSLPLDARDAPSDDDGYDAQLNVDNLVRDGSGFSLKRAVLNLANSGDAEVSGLLNDYGVEEESPDIANLHVGPWVCSAYFKGGKYNFVATNGFPEETKSFSIKTTDRDTAISRAAKLLQPKKQPYRELTQEELIIVSRIASGGNQQSIESAVYTYLNYAGIREDISSKPEFQEFCDEIVFFCFRHAYPAIDDDAELWMMTKLGDRPATISNLYSVYELWQDWKKEHRSDERSNFLLGRQREPEPEEVSPESLDDLDDEAIGQLYKAVRQERARQLR